MPEEFRYVLVSNIQSIVIIAATPHAEYQVDKIARVDEAVVVFVCDDRYNIAIDPIILVLSVSVEIQLAKI